MFFVDYWTSCIGINGHWCFRRSGFFGRRDGQVLLYWIEAHWSWTGALLTNSPKSWHHSRWNPRCHSRCYSRCYSRCHSRCYSRWDGRWTVRLRYSSGGCGEFRNWNLLHNVKRNIIEVYLQQDWAFIRLHKSKYQWRLKENSLTLFKSIKF